LEEQPHIKEKSAALIVEIAKREWPQMWQEFIPTLNNLANAGVLSPSLSSPFFSLSLTLSLTSLLSFDFITFFSLFSNSKKNFVDVWNNN
jgi:hypothetical protein